MKKDRTTPEYMGGRRRIGDQSLHLRLPRRLLDDVNAEAARLGLSQAETVRRLLRDQLRLVARRQERCA